MTRRRLVNTFTALVSIAAIQWVSAQEPAPLQVPVQLPVDQVRHLYESAAYEDALETIGAIVTPPSAARPAAATLLQYRALCLLALDRTPEADAAVEELLMLDPDYSADANETSPRFVSVLDRIRNRVLPVLAQKQYEEAKGNFDQQRLLEAATGFARVIALLDHPAIDGPALEATRDLRTLAAGFLELSRATAQHSQQSTAAQAAPPQPAAAPSAPQPAHGASAPADKRIYSAADADVTPPTTVRQDLPEWRIGTKTFAGNFEGRLDIVIDETGEVESATLVKSIFPAYNAMAIAGSKEWRYEPAMKSGVPVKFRKPVVIRLNIPK